MKKPLLIILGTIAVLVAFLFIWAFTFGEDGAIATAINAVVDVLNGYWEALTGNAELLPKVGTPVEDFGDNGLNRNPFGGGGEGD